MKSIFDIKIEFNGKPVEMKGVNAEVVMIPFKGYVAKSDLFTGIVEPCGVDTQVVNAAKVRHMSARYMLTGKDKEGNDCHIYIENNGYFDEFEGPHTAAGRRAHVPHRAYLLYGQPGPGAVPALQSVHRRGMGSGRWPAYPVL